MKIFGKKEIFAISVEYTDLSHLDKTGRGAYNYPFWGEVCFYVHGKNLFELEKRNGKRFTFWQDLNILINFFSESLYYHVHDDPYPAVGINAKNFHDESLIGSIAYFTEDEADYPEAESQQDQLIEPIQYSFKNIKITAPDFKSFHTWEHHHSLGARKEDSFLPCLDIGKKGNQVEFSYRTTIEFFDSFYMVFKERVTEKGKPPETFFEMSQEFYDDIDDHMFSLCHQIGLEFVDIKLYKQTILEFCFDCINHFKDKYPGKMKQYENNLAWAIGEDG